MRKKLEEFFEEEGVTSEEYFSQSDASIDSNSDDDDDLSDVDEFYNRIFGKTIAKKYISENAKILSTPLNK